MTTDEQTNAIETPNRRTGVATGRNFNNKLILESWDGNPQSRFKTKAYFWIKEQIDSEGGDAAAYSKSEIVQQVDDSLMQLGKEESTAIAETK